MVAFRPTRRHLVAGALAGLAAPGPVGGQPAARAPAGAFLYGAAVRGDRLQADTAYREAIAAHCQVIVPESELKWDALRPSRDQFRFEAADRIAAFAAEKKLRLRGHTLAWYGAMPSWVDEIRTRAEAERALVSHIETVVGRYRGRIESWDVVNEPIPDKPQSPSDLRSFAWTKHLGEAYLPIAFRAAHAADPAARLVLNEYDVEFVGPRFEARRQALIHRLRRLAEQNVPIHALGLQAHLFADRAIDRDGLRTLLAEARALNLDVLVTELDVIDGGLPGPLELRDALVAAKAYEFLEAVFETARPSAVLTWGLSDRYTWVPIYFKRSDGRPNRPLPLDDVMRPKLLMQVIEHFRRRTS